jgi:site-specific DNA-methyltransferase (adenine-specific)
VVLDEAAAAMLDEQSGERTSGLMRAGTSEGRGLFALGGAGMKADTYGDSGGASRFFYTAKASRSERETMEGRVPEKRPTGTMQDDAYQWPDGTHHRTPARNHHPTVKPLALMRWLVRLVTPPGGLILDPFAGSGTTGCAALAEGFRFVGIEREPEYAAIAEARLNATQPSLSFAPTDPSDGGAR